MTIKELVKDKWVKFDHYRQGYFYYNIIQKETVEVPFYDDKVAMIKETKYQFPIPIEDVGTATLLDFDKSITFMRWIRKAIDDKTLIKL